MERVYQEVSAFGNENAWDLQKQAPQRPKPVVTYRLCHGQIGSPIGTQLLHMHPLDRNGSRRLNLPYLEDLRSILGIDLDVNYSFLSC